MPEEEDDQRPPFEAMRTNGRGADDWIRRGLDRLEAEANADPEAERRDLAAQLFGRPDPDDTDTAA